MPKHDQMTSYWHEVQEYEGRLFKAACKTHHASYEHARNQWLAKLAGETVHSTAHYSAVHSVFDLASMLDPPVRSVFLTGISESEVASSAIVRGLKPKALQYRASLVPSKEVLVVAIITATPENILHIENRHPAIAMEQAIAQKHRFSIDQSDVNLGNPDFHDYERFLNLIRSGLGPDS